MRMKRDRTRAWNARATALLTAAGLSLAAPTTQLLAVPDLITRGGSVSVVDKTADSDATPGAIDAAGRFVRAMAAGDADAVWMFATEEEHDAFQVKSVALQAYLDDFPVLTRAEEVRVVRTSHEGGADFLDMIVRDRSGDTYWAHMGLWLDDAGDWKLISLGIERISEFVAGL